MVFAAKILVLAILPAAIFGMTIAPLENDEGANKTQEMDSHPQEKGLHFEGDMILTPGQLKRSGINGNFFRWPNRVVYYAWAGVFVSDTGRRNVVLQAMAQIQQRTCIRFAPVPAGQSAYVLITSVDRGCYANVGRTGRQQLLNLNVPEGCVHVGVAMHELMHAIGFWHEQSRPDRDQYVRINWQNIEPRFQYAFDRYPDSLTFGVGYDYASIMHYSSHAFSMNNQPTIEAWNGTPLSSWSLSANDVLKINRMYGC